MEPQCRVGVSADRGTKLISSTRPPFGFYWFALATASDQPTWHTPAPEPLPEFVTMVIRDDLAKALCTSAAKLIEEEALPQYIAKRRCSD